ncbi:MAG TPA: hypothetical protein VF910_07080, partial [Candidatus Bathyarchaeia archaeon]
GQALASLGIIERPLTRQNVDELAAVAAQNTVEGFIAQDRLDFDGAVLHWSQVFHALYPELDSERVVKAAEAFVTALFAQSKLKDDNSDPYVRVHSETWQYVRNELVRMCGFLNLPASFGIETSDFYRYHSIHDDSYVKHIIEFHRVLMRRLTGEERAYRELAGLYLSALSLHDQHTIYGVKKARELMNLYYTILFEAKYGAVGVKN